ncbi:MAG: hypothetical protein DDG59_00015 [Anaerolineae bacterium]|nr:MAG: hypothetical protein DDG59_00015 [Anaerolineae bacterium]
MRVKLPRADENLSPDDLVRPAIVNRLNNNRYGWLNSSHASAIESELIMIPKRIFLVVLMGTLVLTACIPGIFPPTPLLANTGYNLDTLTNPTAIAIEPNGRKSVFWLEKEGTTRNLIYWRTHFGEPTLAVSRQDRFAAAPDVAVTDSGTAYLVWYSYNPTSSQNVFYTATLSEGSTSINPVELYAGALYDTPILIRVIARGETVYVVYPAYGCLRYKRLSPTPAEGKVADYLIPNSSLQNLQVTIDSSNKLHVAWVEKGNPMGNVFIRYNSNATITPARDMNQGWNFGPSTDSPGDVLDITVADTPPNEKVYLIYRFGSNQLYYGTCLANGCPSMPTTKINLSPSTWLIWELKAVGIGSSVYVAFLAQNSSTTFNELFYITNLAANPAEQRITNSDYSKANLHMVRVQWQSTYLPLVGWRRYTPSPPYALDDAYVWAPNYGLRQVFTSTSTARHQGSDLAANGEWVAGVWAAETNGRVVPFLSGNAYLSSLPLVSKK